MMTGFAITNLVSAVIIMVLSAVTVYQTAHRLITNNIYKPFRFIYIFRVVIGVIWFGVFAYSLTFDNFSLPPYIGAIVVRPALILTLTSMLIGQKVCKE